jgi:hypothetical protein
VLQLQRGCSSRLSRQRWDRAAAKLGPLHSPTLCAEEPYSEPVRCWMYLAGCTRPDTMQQVGALAQHISAQYIQRQTITILSVVLLVVHASSHQYPEGYQSPWLQLVKPTAIQITSYANTNCLFAK